MCILTTRLRIVTNSDEQINDMKFGVGTMSHVDDPYIIYSSLKFKIFCSEWLSTLSRLLLILLGLVLWYFVF